MSTTKLTWWQKLIAYLSIGGKTLTLILQRIGDVKTLVDEKANFKSWWTFFKTLANDLAIVEEWEATIAANKEPSTKAGFATAATTVKKPKVAVPKLATKAFTKYCKSVKL